MILLVWFGVAFTVTWLRGVPFPTPTGTVSRLIEMVGGHALLDRSLFSHTMASLIRWCIGFVVAATAGILFGMAAGWWRPLERIAMPSVHVLQLVPGLAWIPVAILIFGIGEGATLFMIAVTAFAPVAINVANGVKRVDEMYVRAARMMGASNRMLFLLVLLPGALPHIVSGLRVGLGNGWRVLVAAEMIVGSGAGLGYAIIQSRWTLDYTGAFVCLMVICAVGLVVEQLIFAPLERRTVERWGLKRAA
jgi:ABC-type nitrate/sulfonate/bicarbonate transport system permease component